MRQEQKEKRRFEILAAGLDLFIHKGYAATKISDIAQRVGMSVGLLFHYFPSKESLYQELVKLGIAGPVNMMTPGEMEPLAFFEHTARQVVYFIQADHFTAKMFVLMNHVLYNDSAPQGVKELLAGFDIYTPTAQLIEQGQKNGTIREGEPFALAIAFWGAIQGIALHLAVNPHYPCPHSDWVVDIIRRKQ